VSEFARVYSSAKAPSVVSLIRDVTEEPSRITRIFYDPVSLV
jgi:hypothetical protein